MDQDSPLVSILITSYNREKYIADSIQSAQSITYPNIEIIVSDDCSEDKTFDIACEFAKYDERIFVYKTKSNLGQFANRNHIARLANGKYLKYLDSDDEINAGTITTMVDLLEQHPEVAICIAREDISQMTKLSPKNAIKCHFIDKLGIFNTSPLSWLIRHETFRDVGGFTVFGGEGDYAFLLKIASTYNMIIEPMSAGYYREHDEQIDFIKRSNSMVVYKYYYLEFFFIYHFFFRIDKMVAFKILMYTLIKFSKSVIRNLFFTPVQTFKDITQLKRNKFQ